MYHTGISVSNIWHILICQVRHRVNVKVRPNMTFVAVLARRVDEAGKESDKVAFADVVT